MSNIYTIKYNKKVIKFLSKYNEIHERFYEKIKIMILNPFDPKLDIKTLKWENTWSYRLRIGKYRFVYMIVDQDVVLYF